MIYNYFNVLRSSYLQRRKVEPIERVQDRPPSKEEELPEQQAKEHKQEQQEYRPGQRLSIWV